ncbi:MAG: ATP-binding protein [Oligoflexia bacterium]|nr:ATP-binding protein [Oligoflexia bacterium]
MSELIAKQKLEKINILLVDDREDGLLALEAVLKDPEYNLIKVQSGRAALSYLLANECAVILLDVQMPGMDGFEVASLIKKREKSKDIPIIFVTAINKDINYIYQGYEAGGVDYILKPFDPHILRSKVAVFIDLYRKNKLILEQSEQLRIHERARLEIEELRRFKKVADSIPHIVWIVKPSGEIEFCNEKWGQFTGAVAKSNAQFLVENVHPTDRPQFIEKMTEAVKNKSDVEIEFRLKSKTNQYYWFLGRAIAVKDEMGDLIRWFGTATEIEVQKQVEEKRKFLDELSTHLMNSLDPVETLKKVAELSVNKLSNFCSVLTLKNGNLEPVTVAHKDPSKLSLVQEFITKYPVDMTSPIGSAEVIRSGNSQFISEITTQLLEANAKNQEHLDLLKKLQIKSYIGASLFVRGIPWGVLSFFSSDRAYEQDDLILAQDIAYRTSRAVENALLYQEVVTAHATLERSNRELEQFAYVASHDLQEPLRMVSSYVQLLERRYGDKLDKDAKDFIGFAVEGAQRMQQLVSDLLTFSRVTSRPSDPDTVDFNEILSKVKRNLSVTIEETGAKIILGDLPILRGDSTQYLQLFQNLVANALKFRSSDNPIIKISANKDGDFWTFSVSDNGMGIEPQHSNRIFEIFKRLHTRTQYPGSGIGLAICKKIVEGHAGKIWVESTIGKGATFHFTLPIKKEVSAEQAIHDKSQVTLNLAHASDANQKNKSNSSSQLH